MFSLEKVEQVLQNAMTQVLAQVVVPIFGTLAIVVLALELLCVFVQNRAVRVIASYGAVLTWLGWMANIYRVA
jgi:hypothetical protein